MAITGINKEGVSFWCGIQPFIVVWWHFHVAGWNFEEIFQHLLHHKWKKLLYGIIINVEKATKVHMYIQCLSFQAWEDLLKCENKARYSIIEVPSVKALSLRGNPRKLYRAKHLPSQNGTYSSTEFYSGQTSYLNPLYTEFHFLEVLLRLLIPCMIRISTSAVS